MLAARRRLILERFDAVVDGLDVVHRHCRFRRVVESGVARDDTLTATTMPPTFASARPTVTIILDGVAKVNGASHVLREGEAAVNDGEIPLVTSPRRRRRGWVVQWDASVFGAPPRAGSLRLDARARRMAEEIDAAFEVAESGGAQAHAQNVAAVFELLRAIGVGVRPVDARELVHFEDSKLEPAVGALGRALASFSSKPMMTDFEAALDRSTAQSARLVNAAAQRLLRRSTWREARDYTRMQLGSMLVTARGATTESVARLLGYSSPTAFCRAAARAGLPSPGAIARRAAELA